MGGVTPEPEWVDLGLPSGLLWCKTNIGAKSPEHLGLYFSWGNLQGHESGAGYNFSQDVYNSTPAAAISSDLSLDQDAARRYNGRPWRMPSSEEFRELYANCSHEWTTINGVHGILFTSNRNGRTLFFPAAGFYENTSMYYRNSHGYYWSSTIFSEEEAYLLHFTDNNVSYMGYLKRYRGYNIRPVIDPHSDRSIVPSIPGKEPTDNNER